jgi:hypothetical protein
MGECKEEMDLTIQEVVDALERFELSELSKRFFLNRLEGFLYAGGPDKEEAEACIRDKFLVSPDPDERRYAISRLLGLEEMNDETLHELREVLRDHPEDRTFLEQELGEPAQFIFAELEKKWAV